MVLERENQSSEIPPEIAALAERHLAAQKDTATQQQQLHRELLQLETQRAAARFALNELQTQRQVLDQGIERLSLRAELAASKVQEIRRRLEVLSVSGSDQQEAGEAAGGARGIEA